MPDEEELTTVRRAWLDRLVDTVRHLGASATLADALEVVARAVTEELGFAACAVNVTQPTGDLRVEAAYGPVDMQAPLGRVGARVLWDELLTDAESWGALRFHGHERDQGRIVAIPHAKRPNQHPTGPGDWDEDDALLALMYGRDGDLIGVISVDQPLSGRLPDREQCVGLELFASQAALVIAAANRGAGLRDQAHLYRTAFRGASVPTLVLDAALLVLDANEAAGRLLGVEVADLLDRPLSRLVQPLDEAVLLRRCHDLLAGQAGPTVVEHRVLGRGRVTTWVRTSIAPVASAVSGTRLVLNLEDVTEARRTLAELHLLADLDPLTGLPNRHATYDLVAEAVDRCGPDEAVAVLVVSIDGYKDIVHDRGARVADDLAVQLAHRLGAAMPLGVRLGRLVGDELVAIGTHDGSEPATVGAWAQACLDTARAPFDAVSVPLPLTLSVGVASTSDRDVEPASLLQAARVAGFEAHVGGGDRWRAGELGDPRG